MNHVRVITTMGQEVEITHEEAQRIARSISPRPVVDNFHKGVIARNDHYLHKADENIREIADKYGFSDFGGSEEELKELLSAMLNVHEDIGNLIVEIAEQRIATHHHEIYSV